VFSHERLEPIHGKIALGRLAHLFYQAAHLVQTIDVERQEDAIENDPGIKPQQQTVGDGGNVAAYRRGT
jgi:hypothetical protein